MVDKLVIDAVLISPETPSQKRPKKKISEKYIVNLTYFGMKYHFCSHFYVFAS